MIGCRKVARKQNESFLHQSKCVAMILPAITVAMRSSFWLGATSIHRQTREAHRTVFVCEMDTRDDGKAEKRRHVLISETWQRWSKTFDSRGGNEGTNVTSWFGLDGTNKSGLVVEFDSASINNDEIMRCESSYSAISQRCMTPQQQVKNELSCVKGNASSLAFLLNFTKLH